MGQNVWQEGHSHDCVYYAIVTNERFLLSRLELYWLFGYIYVPTDM